MKSLQQNIRNFAIISHIDHGKSTLADRLLELTGTIEKRKMRQQMLDQMDLEREKGITIKLQPVRMEYKVSNVIASKQSEHGNPESSPPTAIPRNDKYILNLIDTPGHVDFSYEVSRSLAAVEGAILLVDATKGIQAQTLNNLYLALEQNLTIIPVVNKIDITTARINETTEEVARLLGINPQKIIKISAKYGTNVEQILEAIVGKIPPPKGNSDALLRALIFDSVYDPYKGVIAYIKIFDGCLEPGNKIFLMASKAETESLEVGIFKPELTKITKLQSGEIGWVATGLKEIEKCRVGDTITKAKSMPHIIRAKRGLVRGQKSKVKNTIQNSKVKTEEELKILKTGIKPLPGYKEPKPMVFASLFSQDPDDFEILRDGLRKLKLNDASLSFEAESLGPLGRGFKCGFLGMLHLEIITERLRREYGIDLIITTPSVVYKIIKKTGQEIMIYTPQNLPDSSQIQEFQEPYAKLEIILPKEYLGQVMKLLGALRGIYKATNYLNPEKVIITYEAPLADVIAGFYDRLKSASSGFASMNYELIGYRKANLTKLDILIAGEKVKPFSQIVPAELAYQEGKRIVEKLKEILPRQNFAVALQAAIESKIIARETIKPFRKDVTAKLYGGDVTRKRKLLEKQKKGKKKMKTFGRVDIPQEAFLAVLKK